MTRSYFGRLASSFYSSEGEDRGRCSEIGALAYAILPLCLITRTLRLDTMAHRNRTMQPPKFKKSIAYLPVGAMLLTTSLIASRDFLKIKSAFSCIRLCLILEVATTKISVYCKIKKSWMQGKAGEGGGGTQVGSCKESRVIIRIDRGGEGCCVRAPKHIALSCGGSC